MTAQPNEMAFRPWLSPAAQQRSDEIQQAVSGLDASGVHAHLDEMVERNRELHEGRALNLNPATNVMNPRAEAMLSAGLGTRPSLGHPGEKYEMGLQALEDIEVTTQALACEIFNARFAEVRVSSGAMANLYVFMATAAAGDSIIVPPASIGGHVTHHDAGAAGLYGLDIHEAPIDAANHTIDVDGLAEMAQRVRPKLITIGASLNLLPHPIEAIRSIANEVGAVVMFDAAHLSGLIAGGAWPNPLARGAHVMTMSTYKSLGGPPSGLCVTNDAALAERIDAIAYPGLTANFDVASSAALAVTLLDWRDFGADYAASMVDTAAALGSALEAAGVPLVRTDRGVTESHAFAIDASNHGGGDALARHLETVGILASAIGLPVDHGTANASGLRVGTPEAVRWGMRPEHMADVADFISRAMAGDNTAATNTGATDTAAIHRDLVAFRDRFRTLHFIHR